MTARTESLIVVFATISAGRTGKQPNRQFSPRKLSYRNLEWCGTRQRTANLLRAARYWLGRRAVADALLS